MMASLIPEFIFFTFVQIFFTHSFIYFSRFEVQAHLLSLLSPFLATLLAQAGPCPIISVPFPEALIRFHSLNYPFFIVLLQFSSFSCLLSTFQLFSLPSGLFASLLEGRGLTPKEVDLASTLGFQGVLIAEDVSETSLPTDQNVAKAEERLRIKRDIGRLERLVGVEKSNENKPTSISIYQSQDAGTLYPCEMCGKHFKNKWKVQQHLKSHGADRVLCNICSKTYLNNKILKTHMQTHNEDQKTTEDLACILCTKSFRNKYILKYHMNSHRDEKLLEAV